MRIISNIYDMLIIPLYLFQSIVICSDIDLLKHEDQNQQEKTFKGQHELKFAEVSSMLMLHQCTTFFLAVTKVIFVLKETSTLKANGHLRTFASIATAHLYCARHT